MAQLGIFCVRVTFGGTETEMNPIRTNWYGRQNPESVTGEKLDKETEVDTRAS